MVIDIKFLHSASVLINYRGYEDKGELKITLRVIDAFGSKRPTNDTDDNFSTAQVGRLNLHQIRFAIELVSANQERDQTRDFVQ